MRQTFLSVQYLQKTAALLLSGQLLHGLRLYFPHVKFSVEPQLPYQ